MDRGVEGTMVGHRKALVIGAGIAGLAAAYEMKKAGWTVVVVDRNAYPGGRMANVRKGRMLLETGATEIFSFYRDFLELVAECGLSDQLVECNVFRSFTIRNGKSEYVFDFGKSPLALLFNKNLSFRSRLRLINLIPDLLRFRRRVDPCFLEQAAEFDGTDTRTYLTTTVGADFCERFIAPVFRLFWRWQPNAFSSAYFLTFMAHVLGCKIYTMRDGVGSLTKELASRMDVRLDAEVQSVNQRDGGGIVASIKRDGVTYQEAADVVIMATEASVAARIVRDLDPAEQEFLQSVRYTQSMAAHYLLKREATPGSIIYAAEDTSRLLSYTQLPSGFPGFPDVPSRLWVSLTPEYLEANVLEDGSNLDELTRPYVKAHYPELERDLLEAHMQYKDLRLVLVYPGYVRKLKAFLDHQRRKTTSVFYCGDYLAHPHAGGACASGRRVSREIVARFAD